MYAGFPLKFMHLIKCPYDSGELGIYKNEGGVTSPDLIWDGDLVCRDCTKSFRVDKGIVNLLEPELLDHESAHELKLRDMNAEKPENNRSITNFKDMDKMEMLPTIDMLGVGKKIFLLELGCGSGRYTRHVLNNFPDTDIIAVDFSINSLKILSERLMMNENIGLVRADITKLKLADNCFDRILSTLVSNLPSREHRNKMFNLAAKALKADGLFVFSTHHYNLRDKIENVKKIDRYTTDGIYRYYFTKVEIKKETKQYFKNCNTVPIQIVIPFANRFGLPIVKMSLVGQKIPFLNNFAKLLLVRASLPIPQ